MDKRDAPLPKPGACRDSGASSRTHPCRCELRALASGCCQRKALVRRLATFARRYGLS